MAVTTTTNSVAYTGDGTSVAFAVPYAFFADTDLLVYLTDTSGNTTLQTLTTNYSVSGGNDAVGTVTFNAAPASGDVVLIVRNVPFTQPDEFQDNDILDATVWMQAIDRLTLLCQQALYTGSRSITQPAADSNTMSALPTVAQRANKFLAFDANGNPIASTQTGTFRNTWAAGTVYYLADIIVDGAAGNNTNDLYVCAIANTASSSFANDVAAGDWVKVIDIVLIGQNASNATLAALSGTSTTSLTVGTGAQSLTTQTNKSFDVGRFVILIDSANTANWMIGQVTAYDAATGALTVDVSAYGGSGTIATWSVYQSAYSPNLHAPGPIGDTTPDTGTFTTLKANDGTAGNEVVNYGQMANSAPVGGGNAASGTSIAATTGTLTAPSKGNAIIFATATTGTAPGTSSLVLTSAHGGLVSVFSVANSLGAIALAYVPMNSGDTATFTGTYTVGASGSLVMGVSVIFQPTP